MSVIRIDESTKAGIRKMKKELADSTPGITPGDISDNDIVRMLLEMKESVAKATAEATLAVEQGGFGPD